VTVIDDPPVTTVEKEVYVPKARRLKDSHAQNSAIVQKGKPEPEPELDQISEPSETESTNESENETQIDILNVDDKQYVMINGSKLFNHPGKDEIESISELGQLIGLRLHDGSIEWI
jgi:hypothetical protein